MEEHLNVLDLDRSASWKDVKKAYHQAMKVWHPDRFGEDEALRVKAESKTKEINEAYKKLESGWKAWERSAKFHRLRLLKRKAAAQDTSLGPSYQASAQEEFEESGELLKKLLKLPFKILGYFSRLIFEAVVHKIIGMIVFAAIVLAVMHYGFGCNPLSRFMPSSASSVVSPVIEAVTPDPEPDEYRFIGPEKGKSEVLGNQGQ